MAPISPGQTPDCIAFSTPSGTSQSNSAKARKCFILCGYPEGRTVLGYHRIGRYPPQTINPLTLFVTRAITLLFLRPNSFTLPAMNNPTQPNIKLISDPSYRENYANSVQMRVNIWDFFLIFGTLQQQSETQVEIRNFQGIYLSPQQAKALLGLLQQNVASYEGTFGEIKLDPRMSPGPVH
jgi:flagellar protein FlaG